jgi:tetraacyldisaccharide-1-P 4'-kinase
LEPDELIRVGGTERRPLAALRGARVVAISAIGDAGAFIRQLQQRDAVVESIAFRDHHRFGASDVERAVEAAGGAAIVVCTLKDAVKLRDLWPREAPALWYVSQRLTVERGIGGIERLLDAVLRARDIKNPPAHTGPV